MTTPRSSDDRLLRVRGTVQGVGFRPFVARLAGELGVRGWVRNDAGGVLARVVAPPAARATLAERIGRDHPPAARVASVEWLAPGPADPPAPAAGFAILASDTSGAGLATAVPADLAPCPACRRELGDARDRRHHYPFINCTQCGPRYSLIESLPYDRPRTTMRRFTMCPSCGREYGDPADRRFHAEPNACPACGPRLLLSDPAGRALAEGAAALAAATDALRAGGIVAVKGVGGFHLMVDASVEDAVADLRRRKHREEKPFAVMFRDLDMLHGWAEVSPAAAALLASPRCPIVLLPARPEPALAPSVAPGNPWIGALLPPSPLHLLLTAAVNRPLVATSANLSDEPLCTDDDEARTRLAGIADLFLGHDRPIARPVDDSVVRLTAGGTPLLLRRARGYAPTPVALPAPLPDAVLCVGAQMKNTIAVAARERVVLSPHLGDLDGEATYRVFQRTIETLGALCGARFDRVACDKHPDYPSTRHARGLGLPLVPVQHHLAHVLAVLLEHGQAPDGVLGVAWDGTGYGEDGTVWGGEFILLQHGRASRFARLRPFRLLGSEAAVRDARRVAFALAAAHRSPAGPAFAARSGFTPKETATLEAMLAQGLNSPLTSSVGRLFDGVGALLGLGRHNRFEGQTPLAVEIAATRAAASADALRFDLRLAGGGAVLELDWWPAVDALLAAQPGNEAALAAAFHRGLAHAVVETARRAGVGTVVLSGGCFQNALLSGLAHDQLAAAGFRVLTPRELPANDGAISAGQAAAALWNLTTVELPPAPPPAVPSPTPTH